ncbi:NAD(P)-dependent alcohol dehydrogenase [Saccharospirillum impatiens]|uniref:NAD(P)-dependent alcohol dehydrogenase n=1 Tax=Saccharospirillum impatiens TaxID=169438 RepID=UPI0003F79619|nr:NAD(P)-dependent alcohol dehydrogenase [Saccharospirillum impatiens]
MKAITYRAYGTPDVLKVENVLTPTPKDDEVCIRVHAAEATKSDCELRSFHFPVKWFWLPLRLFLGVFKPRKPILGGYFAGEVVSVGDKVTRFKPGDRLFGSTQFRLGAYGEYLCLPAHYTLVRVPDTLSSEEAAAVPLGGLNALHFMSRANIKPGDKVLINGAGGSIGSFAVQIAKSMGAEVTAVDAGFKETRLRGIGADHFIDYTHTDPTRQGLTYDVIFNMVAQSEYPAWVQLLNDTGYYLIGNPRLSDMLRAALTNRFTRKKAVLSLAGEKQEELETLSDMIEAGAIKPLMDSIYPMQEAPEAHRRVETEQRVGCVVISMRRNT